MVRLRLIIIPAIALILAGLMGCKEGKTDEKRDELGSFRYRVLNDTSDFYHVDFASANKLSDSLPIGIFDSGTGGLTVMEAIVKFDNYVSSSGTYDKKGDGIPDFKNERFIYFGDQANMPYGNYADMNKTPFLKQLVLRDALFLMGHKYYLSASDRNFQRDKQGIKLLVIACNTATAYGKEDVENMLASCSSPMKVIGVIDAGVRGALSGFGKEEDGTIAVMATAGTVSSNGYLNAFNSIKQKLGYTGKIEFLQQSGYGIAEAVDEEPSFLLRSAVSVRQNYKGPSMNNSAYSIRKDLMQAYNFDTTGNALLCIKEKGNFQEVQLNSAENYISFHLVSLCEQLKAKKISKPLKTLILGCTHYPYYTSFFQKKLKELRNLKTDGKYVYRNVLNDSVIIVDPAVNTAKEVHEYISEHSLTNRKEGPKTSQFYISVPDTFNKAAKFEGVNNFTYDYKYGRDFSTPYDTKQVPLNNISTSEDIMRRIARKLPQTYSLIEEYNNKLSSKTK